MLIPDTKITLHSVNFFSSVGLKIDKQQMCTPSHGGLSNGTTK
jgi:hypothetical protein